MKKPDHCKEHKSPSPSRKTREDQKPRPRGVRRDPHAVIRTKPVPVPVPFPVTRQILWDEALKPTPGIPPEYRLADEVQEIPPKYQLADTPRRVSLLPPQGGYGKFGSGLAWSGPPQQPLAWYTSLWMWFSAWVANLFVTRSNRS